MTLFSSHLLRTFFASTDVNSHCLYFISLALLYSPQWVHMFVPDRPSLPVDSISLDNPGNALVAICSPEIPNEMSSWGTLINPDKSPAPLLEQLCLGIAQLLVSITSWVRYRKRLTRHSQRLIQMVRMISLPIASHLSTAK